jgi:peptidoglycan hydrolase-like protein with peptidoglycan-binding domain
MAKDKPSFLQNIGDDEEEREIVSVLKDEEPKQPEKEETAKEEKPQEEIKEEEKKEEEKPQEDKTQQEPQKKEDVKKEDATPSEKTEKEKSTEKPLFLGKYKTKEDFEKAHLELQRAFNRLLEQTKKSGIDVNQTKDELDVFRKVPLIKPVVPDPAKYYFKNDNGEDVLDLQGYLKDALNNFAISVQQNLLGGPLSAAVFSMISRAINEEHSQTLEEAKREEEAVRIWDNVQKAFPILSKDERLQNLYEKAIYGEKRRRAIEAERNNTEYVDLTEQDYINLAKEIVGIQQVTPTKQEEPTEKVKGDAILNEAGRNLNSEERELEADIEAMMSVKRKSLF